MAARWEEDEAQVPPRTQCENCGKSEDLLRCSRCRNAWFCSVRCLKAYWPFHKPSCRPNDFADAMEPQDARFATWMRGHGKMAVLKDLEVERLERASQPGGWQGLGREDVLADMYGRANPKPRAPTFNAQDAAKMAAAEESARAQQGLHLTGDARQEAAWKALMPNPLGCFGVDCGHFKWCQNQSHVEAWLRLPLSVNNRQISVELKPKSIRVAAADDPLLAGLLWAEVKVEASTWFIDGDAHVLHLSLLKRCRRGHYADGKTNADTFWRSLLQGAAPYQCLPAGSPPLTYYSSLCDDDTT